MLCFNVEDEGVVIRNGWTPKKIMGSVESHLSEKSSFELTYLRLENIRYLDSFVSLQFMSLLAT